MMKSKILYFISEYLRKHYYLSNIGKFKVGDKVTFNWRAKYQLKSRFIDFNKVYEVAGYYDNNEGIITTCGELISAHWLKKKK